jgi:hypothetical protein
MAISDVVGRGVLDFIDYALFVTAIMIGYYFIRVILFESKEDVAKREEAHGEIRKAIGEKVTKYKEKAEHQAAHDKRHNLLDRVRGWLLRVHHGADEVYEELQEKSEESVAKAKRELEHMAGDLKRARRRIHLSHLHLKGPERTLMETLYTHSNVILEKTQELEKNLPDPAGTEADWHAKVTVLNGIVTQITGNCGALTTKIEEFIDKGT